MAGKSMALSTGFLFLALLNSLGVGAQDIPITVIAKSEKAVLQCLTPNGNGSSLVLIAQNQSVSTVPPPKNFSPEFKEQLEAVLRSHPELILDLLKEHKMATWSLVEDRHPDLYRFRCHTY